MRFIVVHNHFRPGGVRRVIELATPAILRSLLQSHAQVEVLLAGGEAPDELWLEKFVELAKPAPVLCRVEKRAGYFAGQNWKRTETVRCLEAFLSGLVESGRTGHTVFWAHNQGLGRNLALTEALKMVAVNTRSRLVLHHHDWWFDNRWSRWPEMREAGYRSVKAVAETIFTPQERISHVAINRADFNVLQRHFGDLTGWLPNPAEPQVSASHGHVQHARKWLDSLVGSDVPVWLMPVRLLRRKNVGEALLLTRWLRAEAWLVITGGVSSREEEDYAARLASTAAQHRWPLKLHSLKDERNAPGIPSLLLASEAILLTSLQEGFGLPYLEASAAQRPLIARMLPNMGPDLAQFGFKFPQSYDDILVDPHLFDWSAEVRRQRQLFGAWRRRLPKDQRKWASLPRLLEVADSPCAVPFSRLTLSAQLEILSWPAQESWSKCVHLNPWLSRWRALAAQGRLSVASWPTRARAYLSCANYAKNFCRLLQRQSAGAPAPGASLRAQEDFMRERLKTENLYPLVFSDRT